MNAVGKVGTFFAQSVYTVSGPFHPFGGAVDIIVVQQEDGTFKSSPWYVKFGKFQGVLKRREKKVVVAVNDGDANFHMYLDHKGEAYFLKDAPGEEVATFSPPEAVSSGDENSSHMLALEYPRPQVGANPTAAQLGKEESEDEKGYDLELRFEGRDASKQLIQESVDKRGISPEIVGGDNVVREKSVNSAGDVGIPASSPRAEEVLSSSIHDHYTSAQPQAVSKSGRLEVESDNGKVIRTLLNKAIGLQAGVKSTPASAVLANAALAALKSQSSSIPDDDKNSPKEGSMEAIGTKLRRTSSTNGIVIRGLLNQAVGLQPSHRSQPASRLIATAILASLQNVVSDSRSDGDTSLQTPTPHVELGDLHGGHMDVEKNPEDTCIGSPPGKVKEDENPVLGFVASLDAVAAVGPFTRNGNISADDVTVIRTVSSLGSLSGLSETDQLDLEEPSLSGSISPRRTSQVLDVMKTLEVRKLEILDKTLVVEVQEHVEKDEINGLIGSEEQKDISDADARVESIVVDRKELMDKVHGLQTSSGPVGGISGEDGHNLVSSPEQYVTPGGADKLVSVHVDKSFVETLQDALSQKMEGGPKLISEEEKVITSPVKVTGINPQVARSLEVAIPGQELPANSGEPGSAALDDVGDNSTKEISTPGTELALVTPVLSDAGSPRMKAAIELELAWREVMEKAATTLKGAPYTSKKLNYSQSYKKKGLDNGEKKPDSPGRLPQQSERKTWGGWLWGGTSAPQVKRTGEQSSTKDGKVVPRDLGGDPGDFDSGRAELSNSSGLTSELEDASNNGIHAVQNVEGSNGNFEAEGKGAQSESDSGQIEDRKSDTDKIVGRGKRQDQLDFISDAKGQQKVPEGPPPRRRSLFGLLSRTSTNQSSLSSASSLQSNDDLQPILDGLKRETSLERAENVVDLLEDTWERGSEAHRARHGDTWFAKREQESKVVDGGILEGSSAGPRGKQSQVVELKSSTLEGCSAVGALKPVEGSTNLLATANSKDGLTGEGLSHACSISEASELEMGVSHVSDTRPESSDVSIAKFDQGIRKDGILVAEDKGECQQLMKRTNESDRDTTSASSVVDNNTSDPTSSSDMNVLLMSVDGHLLRAPLGLDDNEAPPLAGDREKVTKNPQKVVCFAGVPDCERLSSSPDANNIEQQGMCTQFSASASDEPERHLLTDSSEGKPANHGSERPKGLAKLIEAESVGAGQQSVSSFYPHDSKSVPLVTSSEQLGLHSESGETLEVNGLNESSIDATDPSEFDEMRAMVFEKLEEENERDALDTDNTRIERYYSFRDLTEVEDEEKKEEKTAFKRNLSVYMDAISGEDEQDSSESAREDDLDHSRDKSGPIEIPGATNWVSNFSSEKEHFFRSSSESFPNTRNILVNPDTVSPRLLLSRSLDSATPPSVLSAATGEQSASSDSVLTNRFSTRIPPSRVEKGVVEAAIVDRTLEKVKRESEELNGGMYNSGTQTSAGASSSNNMDDAGMGSETGFELSLCRHLLKERMGLEAAGKVFDSQKVSLEEFKKSGSAIAANDKLIVRVGGRYYPWMVAAPIVLGILAFGQVLIAPNEGAIPVEQPIVIFDGKAAANTSTPSGGGWKLWPFGAIRRPKTPERALPSREAMMVVTEAALKSSLTYEYLRMSGYYKRPRKVRTNSPSSQQLASLKLKEGSNKITFTFETRVWGKQQVDARIYLWKWSTRIVISDVDGTITKSDVLGQVMPLMGRDWTQIGVARLFSAIKKNGYELLFLSARAISQAYLTRQFLENIKQDGEALPDGPMVISPDGLFPSLYREVIRRAPHEFKIACLEDIKSLFPPESKPFYAGFGNRDTDELSYLKVGISKGKIFIINPKGEVVVNNQVDVKSYTSLHKLVDDMFPAMSFTEQEEYNEWNFWKLPLPEIEDEPTVKSVGSSSSRRNGKSGRLS